MASLALVAPLAVTSVAHAHPGYWAGGPGWGFLFFPFLWLFWIALFWFIVVGVLRRRGAGPWRYGAGPSAEAVLAERYARGDIDAEEYQSRLEVLRQRRRP